jgi:hypothetical protein
VGADEVEQKATPLLHKQLVDLNGETIGEVEAVYYRSLTGDPEWLAATVGLMEPKRVLVPLDGATVGDEIRLAQAKGVVEDAPAMDEPVIAEADELVLYSYYGVRRTLPGVEAERNEENIRLRALHLPDAGDVAPPDIKLGEGGREPYTVSDRANEN